MDQAGRVLRAFGDRPVTIVQLRRIVQLVDPKITDASLRLLLEHAGQPTDEQELVSLSCFLDFLFDTCLAHQFRAVSVAHLRDSLLPDIELGGLGSDARVYEIEPHVIRPKGAAVRCLRDGRMGAAYVDSVFGPNNAGGAAYMLSYTWGYKVKDIVETLTHFCEVRDQMPEETYVWICCLCINQHRVKEAQELGTAVPFEDFEAAFGRRVTGIGHIIAMMAPWHEPLYISRVWCDFEMFTAKHVAKSQVTIVMPPREAASLREELVAGQGIKAVWNVLSGLDVEKAQASFSRDRELILQMIRDGPGVHKLNTVIAEHLKDWMLEACEGHVLKALEGPPSAALANLCHEVGSLLADMGYLERALVVLQEGMRLHEHFGTVETSAGADLLANVGEIHEKKGNLDTASDFYDRAADCFAVADEPVALDFAALKRRQGRLRGLRGDLEGKLLVYAEARRICEMAGVLESTEGTVLLSSIGAAKRQAGDVEAAVEAYEEALRIHEQLDTLESPEGATLLSNIGVARLRQKKKKAAKQAFERALSIRERTGTLETSAGATLLTNIADVQELFGDVDGELRLYLQAKDIRQQTGTLDTAAGAVLLSHIGGIFAKRGQPLEALSWYSRAREAREKSESLETDAGAKLLAKTAELLAQEEPAKACDALEEAIGIRRRTETLNSDSGLKLFMSLCSVHADSAKFEEAEEALSLAREVIDAMGDGLKMPGVRLLELCGDLRHRRGDLRGALEAWTAAADLRVALGKESGAPAADLFTRIAAVCDELGNSALSEEFQERAVTARAKPKKKPNLNDTQSSWMSDKSAPTSP